MQVVTRYIIREIWRPFWLAALVFCALLLMGNLFKAVDLILIGGVDAIGVVGYAAHVLPYVVSFSVPVAMFIGVFMAFARLSCDNEVEAFLASGAHPTALVKPAIVVGLLVSLFLMGFNLTIAPMASHSRRVFLRRMSLLNPAVVFQEGVASDYFSGHKLLVDRVEGRELEGIRVWGSERGAYLWARCGRLIEEPQKGTMRLRLVSGGVEQPRAGKTIYERLLFREHDLVFHLPSELRLKRKRPHDLVIDELLEGIQMSDDAARVSLVTELHRRVALSFSPLVLAYLAAPLGVWLGRVARTYGFILAVLIAITYSTVTGVGEVAAARGTLPSWLAMWMPNFLAMAGGSWVFWGRVLAGRRWG